jgi:sugar lactone lactonase YvrE
MPASLRRFLLIAVALILVIGFGGWNKPNARSQTSPKLEVVTELSQAPGNIALHSENRIFLSLHQFFQPEWRVVEAFPNGELLPFPNKAWSQGNSPHRVALDAVLGIQADANDIVWMLDNGLRNGSTPKLVGWDSQRDRLVKIIYLPSPITPENAFVNDLAIDANINYIYIADPAGGDNAALIVINTLTGMARRVLEGHQSVVPEDVELVIDGEPVQRQLPDGSVVKPKVGVNPIALDAAGEWLYFGPMHGTSMYRIRTADLRDTNLSEEQLAARVERYSDKPICDGIAMDAAGNIYLGDLAENAIGVITSDRTYKILFRDDEQLSWIDAFSLGNDDYEKRRKLESPASFPAVMKSDPCGFSRRQNQVNVLESRKAGEIL